MSISVNIYYTGDGENAAAFAREMLSSGLVSLIRAETGNEGYEYFFPMDDEHTVLLIDRWTDQEAIDRHHRSPMMSEIARLRKKYGLRMRVERYIPDEETT